MTENHEKMMIMMTKVHNFLLNDDDNDVKLYSIFANRFANGNL